MTSLAYTLGRSGIATPLPEGRDVTGPEPDQPGLGKLAIDAANSEWITSHLHRSFTKYLGSAGMVDPGYNPLDEREWERLTDGIDPEYWEELTYAKGAAHGFQIRDNILSRQASRQRLAEAGMTGVALSLGANIVDPATLIVGAATGGVGAVGTKASRLQRFMRYGIANAAVDTPLETTRALADPDTGASDVAISVVGSFALGGGLGLGADRLSRMLDREFQDAALRDLRNSELDEIVRNADDVANAQTTQTAVGAVSADEMRFRLGTMRDRAIEGREALKEAGLSQWWAKYIAPISSRKAQRNRIASALDQVGLDREFQDELLAEFDAGGSATDIYRLVFQPDYEPPTIGRATDELETDTGMMDAPALRKKAGDLDLREVDNDSPAAFAPVRFSMAALFGKSKVPVIRLLSGPFVEDALRKTDGRGAGTTAASVWAKEKHKAIAGRFRVRHEAAWRMARQAGVFRDRGQFDESVTAAVVQSDFVTTPVDGDTLADAALKQSVKAIRENNMELGRLAQAHGVPGFEDFETNPFYLNRIPSSTKVQRLVAEYGEDNVADYLARAWQAGSDDLEWDLALRMGKGYLKTVQRLGQNNGVDIQRIFRPENSDVLRRALADREVLDEDDIDDLVRQLTSRDTGISPNAQRRTGGQGTEEFVGQIKTKDGLSEPIRFRTDFFESNIEVVHDAYVRSIVGQSAMSEVYAMVSRKLGLQGDEAIKTRSQFVSRMVQEATDAKESDNYIEALEKSLNLADRVVRGHPIEEDNFGNRALRRMRSTSYLTYGGGFGLAQAAEAPFIAGKIGTMALIRSVPALGDVFRRGVDGKLTRGEFVLGERLGLGMDRAMINTTNRIDAVGDIVTETETGGKFDLALRRMGKLMADVSGLAHINVALQRISALTAQQRFLDLALDGRVVNEAGDVSIGPSLTRVMESLGLSEDRAKRIVLAMRNEAKRDGGGVTTKSGLTGRRLTHIDPDKFEDQEALSDLMQAVMLWSRDAILQPDLGQMHRHMLGPIGKTLLQFQSFHIAAYEKHLLSGIQRARWEEFAAWSASSLVGAMVFSAQMHATAASRDDRKNFLKNRLGIESLDDQISTPEGWLNTLAIGIQRGGYASIAPQLVDLTSTTLGYGPVFNARMSTTSGILGDPRNSPSLALIDNVKRGAGGLGALIPGDDRHYTQSEARAAAQLIPLSRVPVFQQAIELGIRQFPEDE